MKKLSIMLVAFVTLGLSSCSSDDNSNDNNTTASLVGKWEFSQKGYIVDNIETLQPYSHTTGCGKDYIEFKSNNTFEDLWYENSGTGCISESENGTWSQSGTTITTIYLGGSPETIEVVTLDATTLKVKDTYLEDGQTQIEITVFKRM